MHRRLGSRFQPFQYANVTGNGILFFYFLFLNISNKNIVYRGNERDEKNRRKVCGDKLRAALIHLNDAKKGEIESHLSAAVENVLSAVRYERLQPDGPLIKEVSAAHPLVPPYFSLI